MAPALPAIADAPSIDPGPVEPLPVTRTFPPATAPADDGVGLEWLVDNADAYDRITDAIGAAHRAVWITQLAFDADCMAYDRPAGPTGGGTLLAETVLAAAVRAPVDVRILLNATLLLDTAAPLRRFFTARLAALRAVRGDVPGTIAVRGVSRFPQLLHAKMVVVDGTEAFLLGSPFANGYWDEPGHHPVDARRPLRELAGRPVHDLSLRVTGSAVAALGGVFLELWDSAVRSSRSSAATRRSEGGPDTTDGPTVRLKPDATGIASVRVVCTSPRRSLPRRPSGSTAILDAVLEGIARARSCIYLEHQYLSARPVAAALAGALARTPGLEVIAVLNQNADVTAYRRWQNARLAESGLLTHPRAGLFALWSVARGDGDSHPAMLNQVFVHSKALVVDDEWATAGSANLDGVSLHSYGDDFTGALGRRIFRHVRNFDVNVVVDGEEPSATVIRLRTRLWSEHLGLAADALTARPAGGWLPLWRARAAANAAALDASTPGAAAVRMCGLVLPYSVESTPARQLADLGVRVDPARLEMRFNPGWLEVHFSPNWVRNMFT